MITYALAMLAGVWFLQHRPGLPPNSDFGAYLRALPVALIYGTNYYTVESPMSLGHLWRLACEMQFYLLAPLIYLAGGTTERRREAVFGILLALLVGLGMAQPFVGLGKYHFEFAVWPMMLGFCCEYKRAWFLRISSRLVTWILRCSVAICGASLGIMLLGMEMKPLVVATGALLLAPCLMAYLFGRPVPGVAGRGMKWMGERDLNLFVAAAVHALQFSARCFASGRRAGLGRGRRRVVPFLRAAVFERQPAQMKGASCCAENSIC